MSVAFVVALNALVAAVVVVALVYVTRIPYRVDHVGHPSELEAAPDQAPAPAYEQVAA